MSVFRNLPQADWRTFFDSVSGAVLGKWVEVEAASLELGDQIVAAWMPLLGITYDAHDDSMHITLSGFNHLIRQPRDVSVQEGPRGIETVAFVSADGTKQILRLKEPLMLQGATELRAS